MIESIASLLSTGRRNCPAESKREREEHRVIAPCGIDCSKCDLRNVPFSEEAAGRVMTWFHEKGWLKPGEGVEEILTKRMYCEGCRGSREVHWSPSCAILGCCVDTKGLEYCYECSGFPCNELLERSHKSERYAEALGRLREMASCSSG